MYRQYKSNNKFVEKALNKTWKIIGLPFLLIMFLLIVSGLYAIYYWGHLIHSPIPLPLIAIIISILIGTIVSIKTGRKWFSSELDIVEDPQEFIERVRQNRILFNSTINSILKEKGITEGERLTSNKGYRELESIKINNKLILTVDQLKYEHKFYRWYQIKSFNLNTSFKGSVTLNITLESERKVKIMLGQIIASDLEYQLDTYLNNGRNKFKAQHSS